MFRRSKLPASSLYDQDTFYRTFANDLVNSKKSVLIESPFITASRVHKLLPILRILRQRRVHIVINTRDPFEHESNYQQQASEAISIFHTLGIVVLYTAGHHRKLAIVDNQIIWEGSLNILSYNDSCEIMRRIVSEDEAALLTDIIKVNEFIKA